MTNFLTLNTIEQIAPKVFEQEASRHKMNRGTDNSYGYTIGKAYGSDDIRFFRFGGINQKAMNRRLTGADKYARGYFDVYLSVMLMQMFPDGHDNIFLSIAHPPDALPYREHLVNVVGGAHRVIVPDGTPKGKKIGFYVSDVVTWDECSGGIMRAFTRPVGEYTIRDFNPESLRAGDEIAILDLGGKIGSLTPATFTNNKTIRPNFNDSKTFYLGGQDVYQYADEQLRSLHPDLFTKQVDIKFIERFISGRGHVTLRGKQHNFEQAYNNSIAPLLDDLENIYRSLDGLPNTEIVYLSGGFSAIVQSEINKAFVQECLTVDDDNVMHFANLEGGKAITRMVLEDDPELLKRAYRRKSAPVFVVLDLGNTQGKGTYFTW